MFRHLIVWPILVAIGLLSGCGKYLPAMDAVVPDKRKSYQKAESLPDLEIPPDLSTESINDSMAVPEVSSRRVDASTRQDRSVRPIPRATPAPTPTPTRTSIIAEGDPVVLWNAIGAFWAQKDLTLVRDDPDFGVLETQWRQTALGIREKFRVYVKPGSGERTRLINVVHIHEVELTEGVWQEQGEDHTLEGQVTRELQDALSANEGLVIATTASPVATSANPVPTSTNATPMTGTERLQLIDAGQGRLYITLQDNFANVWRETGEALEQAGIKVSRKDRSRGVYHVFVPVEAPKEQKEKEGMLSRMAFWKGEEGDKYQVSVTGVGAKTEIVMLDTDGRWDTSESANDILNQLIKQYGGE